LTKVAAGRMTLTGANTYNGGTTITGGTLQIGSGGTNGSIAGDVLNNGTLAFNRSDDITFANVVSGTGTLSQVGTGTLILTGANTYSGGTIVTGNGTLSVESDPELGATGVGIGGIKLQGGELLTTGDGFNTARAIDLSLTSGIDSLAASTATTATYTGILSDTGALVVGDATHAGTVVLTAANSYSGGTTIAGGTLQIGNGGTSGSIAGDVLDNGALAFNRSDAVTFTGNVSGTGNLSQIGSGTLTLTGTSTYTGATTVSAGTLQINGALGNTALTVLNGATLAGNGTIGGSVAILAGGHLAPGPGAQTLGVGTLLLNSGSILDYQLNTPGVIGSGVSTLVSVAGNLTLAGVLNVTTAGSFGSGAYRLINYTGTLTGLTLVVGTLPAGFPASNVTVTTGVANQVNLVVSLPGVPTQFWDGSNTAFDHTVHGGSGTWDNFTTNFTDAGVTENESWQNGIAIFSAAPGTVTLGDNILFQGMEFTASGYTLAGSGAFVLQPTGMATIVADTGVTATIAAPIAGIGGINKTGPGLLNLTGENSYSGGTTVSAGILSVGNDANLGGLSGGLTLDGGELVATGNGFTTFRPVAITANNGTLAAAAAGIADFQGNITGSGSLTIGDVVNTGIVEFSGTNTYLGATSIVSGITLRALSTGALSPSSAFTITGILDLDGFSNQIGSLAGAGTVTNDGPTGAVLTAGGDNTSTTFSGVLTDRSSLLGLTKAGTGTLTLVAASTYTGGTTISAGTFQIGDGGLTGMIAGDVIDNGILVFNRSDDVTFPGTVSGTGSLTQSGPGTLTLTGANSF
jgi:fibronectin-binding autotransporter adhesin